MKPKRWVDLSAIKRLLVMPSYLCWFSWKAAAAQPHSSCKCSSCLSCGAPSLLSKVSLVSPSLSFPLSCPSRLHEPCLQHPQGWEGRFPWDVHSLVKMPLAVGHEPAALKLLVLRSETAPGTAPMCARRLWPEVRARSLSWKVCVHSSV